MGFVTYYYLYKHPLNTTRTTEPLQQGGFFSQQLQLSSLNQNKVVHLLPRPQHRHEPSDAAGVQQLLSTNH